MFNFTKLILFLAFSLSAFSKGTSFLPSSFKAKFQEEYASVLSGKIKKGGQGIIDYKYPGKIRFETNRPQRIIYVSNPRKSWFYRAPFDKDEPGELTVNPGGKGKENSYSFFFDSLKKGLVSNKTYKVIAQKNSKLLEFSKEGRKKLGMKEAVLWFNKKDKFEMIKEIDLVFLNKKKIKLKLQKIQTKINFPQNHFEFKSPKNTRISK